MTTQCRAIAWLTPLGYLGIWNGMYAAAITAVLVLPDRPRPAMLAFAMLASVSVYLLDRVKLTDAAADPGDRVAHPARFAFVHRARGPLRICLAVLFVASVVLGFAMARSLGLIVIAGHIAVYAYAFKPGGAGRRLKDIVVLKSLMIAAGLIVFAWVCDAADGARPELVSAVALGCMVFADAVLCDIPDTEGDRAAGMTTLPTLLGRTPTTLIAVGIQAVTAAGVWGEPVGRIYASWAGSSLAVLVLPRGWIRDAVDFRPVVLLLVAWSTLA